MQSPIDITALLKTALAEDFGEVGDITSLATIPAGKQVKFVMRTRQELVVCGLVFLPELFKMIDPAVKVEIKVNEGGKAMGGTVLATLSGPARALLAGERTALNLVQQLSGVATLTRQYVDAVAGTNAKILDTRKTIPGLRAAQKYAVRCGGGVNHRMGLYDAVLIKDNHIAVAGGVSAAVMAAKVYLHTVTPSNDGVHLAFKTVIPASFSARRESWTPAQDRGDKSVLIEVECDTLAQLDESLAAGVDSVLLDNMNNATLTDGVRRAHAKGVKVEASGNVNLQTVRAIAETGVDYISVGKLTHSVMAVDIGLDEA